jgi:cytochrome c oxidase subunit II
MIGARARVGLTRGWRISHYLLVMAATACSGFQSVLDPKGPRAEAVSKLHWTLVGVATVVYVIVIGFLIYALWHASHRPLPVEDHPHRETRDQADTMKRGVIIAVAITVIVMISFVFASVSTGSTLARLGGTKPLRIDVVGHQWWWEVKYDDPDPHNQFETANEIHVPVGRPVLIKMTSQDVIHSFWAPNLAGKKDLIPGHETITWFRADSAGIYRGQCAEFCGHQHAKMAFFIVAEPRLKFESWVQQQRGEAQKPTDSLQQTGERVFLTGPCSMCHTVSGTGAASNFGPNLTHVASRLTIGAGTLPNSTGNLAGWILDPQSIKPGVKMPPTKLDPQSLQALLAYLENLK